MENKGQRQGPKNLNPKYRDHKYGEPKNRGSKNKDPRPPKIIDIFTQSSFLKSFAKRFVQRDKFVVTV